MTDSSRQKVLFGKLSIGARFFQTKEAQGATTKIRAEFGKYVPGRGNLVLTARDDHDKKFAIDPLSMVYIEEEQDG